jgi:hypothetical protein
MTDQAIDATVEELGTDLEPVKPSLSITPQVSASELVSRLDVIREAMTTAMQRDVDYGVIPGTDKPTLYKPGSEKLSVLFQLDVQLSNEKHWSGDHLTVESKATVFHAPTGARLGFGEGMCSTRERKYAYRTAQRVCPKCEAPAIIKGKEQYGGGWVCWKKRGGCDSKFRDGDPLIEEQETGEVENPDLPDLWNTVVKMAEKRARIDAVLAVTGASALFTQDLDSEVQPASESAGEGTQEGSPDLSRRPSGDSKPSDSQMGKLRAEMRKHLPPQSTLAAMLLSVDAKDVTEDDLASGAWVNKVSKGQVSGLLDVFASGVLPTGESDVPSDLEPVPEPVAGGEDPFE